MILTVFSGTQALGLEILSDDPGNVSISLNEPTKIDDYYVITAKVENISDEDITDNEYIFAMYAQDGRMLQAVTKKLSVKTGTEENIMMKMNQLPHTFRAFCWKSPESITPQGENAQQLVQVGSEIVIPTKVSELENDAGYVKEGDIYGNIGDNLINNDALHVGKLYMNANGIWEDRSDKDATYYYTDMIACKAETDYYINKKYQTVNYYNEGKERISGAAVTGNVAGGTFKTPANCAYMTVSGNYYTNIILNKGTTADTSAVYKKGIVKEISKSALPEKLLQDIESLKNKMEAGTEASNGDNWNKNLLDGAALTEWATNTNYYITDSIEIQPDTKYYFGTDATQYNGASSTRALYYDANGSLLKTEIHNYNDGGEYRRKRVSVSPQNAVSMQVVFPKTCEEIMCVNTVESDFLIELPDNIYLVNGEEFSIYYTNVIKGSQKFNNGSYYITHSLIWDNSGTKITDWSRKGDSYSYKWTYTPEAAEEFEMSFMIIDTFTGCCLAEKTVSFHVSAEKPIAQKNIMVIGDSFCDGYGVTAYLDQFIKNKIGSNITMIGTQTLSDIKDADGNIINQNTSARDEARSGWGLKTYCTKDINGSKVNPFYNPDTAAFDMSYYMQQNQSGKTLDILCIALGLNDAVWQGFSKSELKDYLDTMIYSAKEFNPDVKIMLYLVTPQKEGDYYMNSETNQPNSMVSSVRAKFYQEQYNEMLLDYEDINNNIYLVPANAHFDTRFGINTKVVYPNKFDTSYEEVVSYDVHPNDIGAQYIADSMYQLIYNIAK